MNGTSLVELYKRTYLTLQEHYGPKRWIFSTDKHRLDEKSTSCSADERTDGFLLFLKFPSRRYVDLIFDYYYGAIRVSLDGKDVAGGFRLLCPDLHICLSSDDVFENRRRALFIYGGKWEIPLYYGVLCNPRRELDLVKPGERTEKKFLLCIPERNLYVQDYWTRTDDDTCSTMSFYSGRTFLPVVKRNRGEITRVVHDGTMYDDVFGMFESTREVDFESLEKWFKQTFERFQGLREDIREVDEKLNDSSGVYKQLKEVLSAKRDLLETEYHDAQLDCWSEYFDYFDMLKNKAHFVRTDRKRRRTRFFVCSPSSTDSTRTGSPTGSPASRAESPAASRTDSPTGSTASSPTGSPASRAESPTGSPASRSESPTGVAD